MVLIKDILLGLWQALLSLVQFFADATRKAGIELDPLIIGLLLAVIALWLFSGCWASSIASSRRHSPLLHFFLGLCAPFVYPLLILFAMDIRGARERGRKQEAAKAKDQQVEEEKRRVAEMVGRELTEMPDGQPGQAEPEAPAPEVFNAEYFTRIARDEQGNFTGPWRVVFGSNEVRVLRILEPLAEVVSVEIEARDGAKAKFRIPYARITVCEPC
jgi:hypothetical protein